MMEIFSKKILNQGRSIMSVGFCMMALLLTFLMISVSPTPASGQGLEDPDPPIDFPPREHRFDNLTIEDGLSQSSVFSIVQDSQGFMWFGTWDGLNRYDGYEFTIYKYNPLDQTSLSNSEIRALYEDSQGELWIGTMNGLCRYDRENDRFIRYQHDPDDISSLLGNRVYAITEDNHGRLWIGTEDGGLSKFDRQTGQFSRYQHNPELAESLSHNDIRSLGFDSQGMLWIGTWGGGLNRFDPNMERFTQYQHDPNNPTSLSDDFVRSVYVDQQGIVWVGTESGGLSRFDRDTQLFTNYLPVPYNPLSVSDKDVRAIYETRGGVLLMGTQLGGLNRFDRTMLQFTHWIPREVNQIWSVYEDRSGILWIGTSQEGVYKVLPETKNFMHYRHDPNDPTSLSGNDVWSIYEDSDGELWVGVWGHGLNRFNRGAGTFTQFNPDPENPHNISQQGVVEITEDHEGMLWIGTTKDGLYKYDRKIGRFTNYTHDPDDPQSLPHNFVVGILEDEQGTLFIGSYYDKSLSKFDRDTETFTTFTHDPEDPHSIGDYKVKKLFEDSEGNLWLTTAGGGLSNFDRETERFTHYTHDPANSNSISHDNTTMVYEDHAGNLWVATFGGGLNKFDPDTDTFTAYLEQDGLPSNAVMGILEDEHGYLWLSTFNGISKFDPVSETFRNYTPGDGLQSLEFNSTVAFKASDGRMFFGGINGFNVFYPEEILDNPHIPPVVLTDFQLPVSESDESSLSNSVGGLDEITLSYQDSVFSFEFAALDYAVPEKNRYRYMLEGFEEEWNEVESNRRFATYTNLDPGEYTFRVLGSNSDGIWNEEGMSIQLSITPPWWGSWWFRGGAVFLLSGLLVGVFVWQREVSHRREGELEATVVERTHALGERIKELDCLYGISRLASRQDTTMEEILNGTVSLLPDAFQFPGNARARVVLDDQEYKMDGFQETPLHLSAAILIQEEQSGFVEVHYRGEEPLDIDDPFLEEERQLLDAVAERLGRIVERLRAEQEVAHERELTQTILDTALDTIVVIDAKTMRYLKWNKATARITGYSDEEFLTIHPLESFFDETEFPKADAAVEELMREGTVAMYLTHMNKDGSKTSLDYTGTVSRNMEGDPQYLIFIGRDISERMNAKEALQASEAKYRELVENISEVIYSLDGRGVVTYLSPAIEEVLGYTPDQIIGQPFEMFIFRDDLERAKDNMSRILKGETPSTAEYRGLTSSGEVRWMRVSSLPIVDEDHVIGFQGVMTDITEIKKGEEQLERAGALAERQRLARELHDSVTQTLYGIDLFSNATAQALSAGRTEEAIDNAQQIQELSHDALGDMRLLIFELQPQIIEERGLAAALKERLDLVESRSGFSTNIRVVDERPLDPSIENELYAIGTEALNNSLKHSKAEHVGVVLEYRVDRVCLMVQDDGIGFDRNDPGATKGFGLRNMEERVSRIGGKFSLDSSPDAGTTVEVEVTA